MSDQWQAVERWQAPFFEESVAQPEPENLAEIEALAQSRGFQVGKWDGLESGRAEAEQIVQQMTQILDEMTKPFRSLDQLVTQELAHMAMVIAKQIIRRELTVSSDVVTDIASEALSTLSSLEGDVEVSLNPADFTMVNQLLSESLAGKPWKLLEDQDVMPGGCKVKTPISYVDASIEKQMEIVFGTLIDTCENQLDE